MKLAGILALTASLALAACSQESSNTDADRSSSNALESAGTDSGSAPAANQAPAAGGLREEPGQSQAGGTSYASGTGGQGSELTTDTRPAVPGSGPGTADMNP